jgi:hypothetical protein
MKQLVVKGIDALTSKLARWLSRPRSQAENIDLVSRQIELWTNDSGLDSIQSNELKQCQSLLTKLQNTENEKITRGDLLEKKIASDSIEAAQQSAVEFDSLQKWLDELPNRCVVNQKKVSSNAGTNLSLLLNYANRFDEKIWAEVETNLEKILRHIELRNLKCGIEFDQSGSFEKHWNECARVCLAMVRFFSFKNDWRFLNACLKLLDKIVAAHVGILRSKRIPIAALLSLTKFELIVHSTETDTIAKSS